MRIAKLVGITILMTILLPFGMVFRCALEAAETFNDWCKVLSDEWQS